MKSEVVLNAATHTYTNTKTGEYYLSVSNLISQFKKPFDKEGVSKKIADREGVDQSVILETWETIKDVACDNGTACHVAHENFIKTGVVEEGFESLINSYKIITAPLIKDTTKIYSEKLLYSIMHKVAGTSDLILETGNIFYVLDFKTNKKFNFFSKYKDYFKSPINYLQQCELTVYGLQLSMYAYLYEQMSGKKCAGLKILYKKSLADIMSGYVPGLTDTARAKLDKPVWEEINCIYMKPAVEAILDNRLKTIKHS